MLLRRFEKSLFFLRHVFRARGKPFFAICFLYGVGMRKIKRKLCTFGADQLIKHAGREYDRLQCRALAAAERSCAESSQPDRHARLRDKRQTEVIPQAFFAFYRRTAGKCTDVFPRDTGDKVNYPDKEQRTAAELFAPGERTEIKNYPGADEEKQKHRRTEIIQLPEQL